MRLFAAYTAVFILITSPALALSCRSQLQLLCDGGKCHVEEAPADLDLDFSQRKGSFCRGERCDDGKVTFSDIAGQWDNRPYRSFALASESFSTISGLIDMGSKTFFGNSEVGSLFGRCE
jgi:hypothetical protein